MGLKELFDKQQKAKAEAAGQGDDRDKVLTRDAVKPPPEEKQPQTKASINPYDDPSIIAKPLGQPDFIGLKPKNPELAFRWGNRVAGDPKGMRLEQLFAQGFQPALPTDVMGNLPSNLLKNGKIVYGDLQLLKISKAEYYGALKWNEQRARRRVRPPGTAERGKVHMREALSEVGGNAAAKRKISTFVPGAAEVEKLTQE